MWFFSGASDVLLVFSLTVFVNMMTGYSVGAMYRQYAYADGENISEVYELAETEPVEE